VSSRHALFVCALVASCAAPSAPPRPVLIPSQPGRDVEPEWVVPTGSELTGRLDATFGGSGVGMFEKEPGEQRFDAITQLADGSFVAVGYGPFGDSYDMLAVHVRANGTLDETFGERGFARVGAHRGFAQTVTHDAEGRILAAGYVSGKNGSDMLIARLDAKGRPDATFGTGGIVLYDSDKRDQPHAVFVRPDGRIVIVGDHSKYRNAVFRFLPTGAVDTEFGTNGVAAFAETTGGYATRGALSPDGGVIAGGYFPHEKRGFVARVDSSGRADPRFGHAGIAMVEDPPMSSAWALAVDPRGRVLLGGNTPDNGAAVVRFSRDGSVDRSFGENGIAWSDRAADDQFYSFAFDSGSNIVGVGFRDLADDAAALVVRFTPNGALDTKFGTQGRVVHKLDGGTFLFAATWDKNGGLVAAGNLWKGSRSRALLMRFR
jgi:uncharacterized delta-60 repeat protein